MNYSFQLRLAKPLLLRPPDVANLEHWSARVTLMSNRSTVLALLGEYEDQPNDLPIMVSSEATPYEKLGRVDGKIGFVKQSFVRRNGSVVEGPKEVGQLMTLLAIELVPCTGTEG